MPTCHGDSRKKNTCPVLGKSSDLVAHVSRRLGVQRARDGMLREQT